MSLSRCFILRLLTSAIGIIFPLLVGAESQLSLRSLQNDFLAARQIDSLYLAGVAQYQGGNLLAQAAGLTFLPQLRLGSAQLESEFGGRRNSASIVQPLFSATRITTLRSQKPLSNLAGAQLIQREIDLARRMFGAYLQVISAREGLVQNQAQLDALNQQRRSAQRLHELSFGTLTDMRDAEVRVFQAQADRLRLQSQLETAQSLYSAIVGQMPPSGRVVLDEAHLAEWENRVRQMQERMMDLTAVVAQNPAVRIARSIRELAELDVTRAKLLLLPDVNANYTYTSINSTGNHFAGISLSMPLEVSGVIGIQTAGAKAAQTAAEMQDVERTVRLEVERLLREVRLGSIDARLAQAAVEAAQLSVEANEKSYRGGVRTSVDVLNAIDLLYTVRTSQVRTMLALADNLLNLFLLDSLQPAQSLMDLERILLS